jgi:nitrogen regulatory protein PII
MRRSGDKTAKSIMKLVSATVRPYLLDDVRRGLEELGRIISVTEVRTYDPRPASHSFRTGQMPAEFVPKIRIEIVVRKDQVDRAVEIIRRTALTGHVGDGNITILPVDRSIRIRTGETDFDPTAA